MRLARSVLVALLALALASIGVAHAAQISLEGTSRVSAQSPTRCDNAVATTTTGATSTSVTVSGIAAACAGRALTVHVYSTSSAPASAPVTVPAGGGSVTVTVPSYAPSTSHKTYVSIGGWPVPSTWSYTAPPAQAIRCYPVSSSVTSTCEVIVTRWDNWGAGYRVDFEVRSTASTPFAWEVELDLSVTGTPAPGGGTLFPGYPVPAGAWWSQWTPSGFSQSNLCSTSTGSQLPKLRLRGAYGWNNMVSASSPATSMGLQASASGPGVSSFSCG